MRAERDEVERLESEAMSYEAELAALNVEAATATRLGSAAVETAKGVADALDVVLRTNEKLKAEAEQFAASTQRTHALTEAALIAVGLFSLFAVLWSR